MRSDRENMEYQTLAEGLKWKATPEEVTEAMEQLSCGRQFQLLGV
jgi:hypothetical protein